MTPDDLQFARRTSRLDRRGFLAAAGATGLASLAGCIGAGGSESDPEGDPDGTPEPESNLAELTDYPYTSPPEVVDLAERNFETTLRTVAARHEVVTSSASDDPLVLPEVWAFAADDGEPSIPGPIYRVPEGETVELTYQNDHTNPHTIHVHAVDKSWKDDGAPETTGHEHLDPGESHTYTIEADVPGTHLYHCHVQTDTHVDMGMYGIFHVVPEEQEPADREYFLSLRDWDSRLHEAYAGGDAEYSTADRDPNVYTVNGRSAPSTFHPEEGSPLIVDEGETVRVHLVNAGYESHPFHTHRHRFEVVAKDGSPIPEVARYEEDVIDVAPAERYTIEFEADADPGVYPAHCHKVDHVTTEGNYPGGMATAIVYEDAMETEEFEKVMEDAGFEG